MILLHCRKLLKFVIFVKILFLQIEEKWLCDCDKYCIMCNAHCTLHMFHVLYIVTQKLQHILQNLLILLNPLKSYKIQILAKSALRSGDFDRSQCWA